MINSPDAALAARLFAYNSSKADSVEKKPQTSRGTKSFIAESQLDIDSNLDETRSRDMAFISLS